MIDRIFSSFDFVSDSTDESRRSQDNAHRPTRQARNGNETGTALALDDPRDFPKLSN